jgi:hypothetical protein
MLNLSSGVAILGLIASVSSLRKPAGEGRAALTLLLLLFAVDVTLLAYGIGAQRLHEKSGIRLVEVVPAFHFLLYSKALQSIFFSFGVIWLLRSIEGFVLGSAPHSTSARFSGFNGWFASSAIVLLAAIVVCSRTAGLRESRDSQFFHDESLRIAALTGRIDLYRWTLGNTNPDDVFLAGPELSLYSIGSAGRKVVSMMDVYSNPYVDLVSRENDRDSMYKALAEFRLDDFAELAARYRVRYVVVGQGEDPSCCRLPEDSARKLTEHPAFQQVFSSGEIRVLRIAGQAP